jgi:putative transposase
MNGLTNYPSDLTDRDWAVVEPLLPVPKTGRPRKVSLRAVVNAIFYQNRTGCQWRFLPRGPGGFPPKSTVFHHYRAWQKDGTWAKLLAALRERARQRVGREPTPSVMILDSQTVKAAPGAGARGYDGGKKVTGRKRHIAVDTLGFLLAVVVTAACVDDAAAAPALLQHVPPEQFPRMVKLYADSKYHNHDLYDTLTEDGPSYELQVVTRPADAQGFVVLAKRWIVERTFAWLGGFRRLTKDVEKTTASSEARVQIAMTQLLLRRVHRLRPRQHQEPRFKYGLAA